MASTTNINYIEIPFRCTQTVDKSLTKAIWIIYIILAESRNTSCSPYEDSDPYEIQIVFQILPSKQRPIRDDSDDTSSVSDALIGRFR